MTITRPEATAAVTYTTQKFFAFLSATTSLVMVFASSASPIPLYEKYRHDDGLTTADLSLAAVAYLIAVMVALSVLGRLSDHLGRRTIGIAAVVLAAAGCLILLDVHSIGTLAAARVLQGIACGLATTALATYVVENAPARRAWISAATAVGAPVAGLSIGALSSGALVQFAAAPRQLVYLLAIAVLSLCALALALSAETVARTTGAVKSLRPRLAVPAQVRARFPATAAIFVAGWAVGGFYQAFIPAAVADDLGTANTVVSAMVFASFTAPTVIGGPLTGRFSQAVGERIGIVCFTLAVIALALGLHVGMLLPVLGASLVAGMSQGAAFTASMRGMLAGTTPFERAGLLATVYLVSYAGAAVTGLVAGPLSRILGLADIAAGYAGLVVVACVVALVVSRRGPTRGRV